MIVRGASCTSSKICRGTRALLNHKPFPVTGSPAVWHTELLPVLMEHGSFEDQTASTFSLADEDHTLANSIRFSLNQDPRVTVCGYSIPHPADARVNIRVQTTGDPASEVFKDACQDLMLICQHVRSTFDQAIADFKKSQEIQGAEDLKTSQDLETMNIKD